MSNHNYFALAPLAIAFLTASTVTVGCGGIEDNSTSEPVATPQSFVASAARSGPQGEDIVVSLPSAASQIALGTDYLYATTTEDPLARASSPESNRRSEIRGGLWALGKRDIGYRKEASLLFTDPRGATFSRMTVDAKFVYLVTSDGRVLQLPAAGGEAKVMFENKGQVEAIVADGTTLTLGVTTGTERQRFTLSKETGAVLDREVIAEPIPMQDPTRARDASYVYFTKGADIVRSKQ
jgi:hypothetical protein